MPNRSQQVKQAALELFNQLDKAACYGKDEYCSKDIYHPMADALLVQSAFNLRKAQCITSAREKQVVIKSFKRLLDHTLAQDSLQGWGLGFEWNDLPENEVFTITTAMVLRAASNYQKELELAQQVIKIGQSCLNHPLLNKALIGPIKAPTYSLGINEHITNTWLYAAAALKKVGGLGRLKAKLLGYIGAHISKASLGWKYSKRTHRVDLLHQAYICQSLMDLGYISKAHDFYVEEFDNFSSDNGYIDKIDLLSKREFEVDIGRLKKVKAIKRGRGYILYHKAEARYWSVGMHLSILSQMVRNIESDTFLPKLKEQQSKLVDYCLSKGSDAETPRNLAHTLLGYTDFLLSQKLLINNPEKV